MKFRLFENIPSELKNFTNFKKMSIENFQLLDCLEFLIKINQN